MGYTEGQEVNNIPYGIPVALGRYTELSGIQKFGYNSAVGSSFETIWDGGNGYTFITTAGTCAVASTSGDDSDAVIRVIGLDANYDDLSEDITVGSTGTSSFHRVHRAFLKSPGTGQTTNVGDITMTVDSTTAAKILAGNGQTLMAIYTIPRHCRGFLMTFNGGTSKNQEIEWRLLAKEINDGAAQTKAYETGIGNNFHRTYQVVEMFQPKTDVYVEAKANATAAVSAGFELILERI